MRRAVTRTLAAFAYGFGIVVVLLTLRPVGQSIVLRARRRQNPAAFDGPAVAASVALAIATEEVAWLRGLIDRAETA